LRATSVANTRLLHKHEPRFGEDHPFGPTTTIDHNALAVVVDDALESLDESIGSSRAHLPRAFTINVIKNPPREFDLSLT